MTEMQRRLRNEKNSEFEYKRDYTHYGLFEDLTYNELMRDYEEESEN